MESSIKLELLKNTNNKKGVFRDVQNKECSIQDSSSVEPMIWIGVDNPTPRYDSSTGKGGANFPLPEGVTVSGRMELNKEMVKQLLPHLIHFSENGEL